MKKLKWILLIILILFLLLLVICSPMCSKKTKAAESGLLNDTGDLSLNYLMECSRSDMKNSYYKMSWMTPNIAYFTQNNIIEPPLTYKHDAIQAVRGNWFMSTTTYLKTYTDENGDTKPYMTMISKAEGSTSAAFATTGDSTNSVDYGYNTLYVVSVLYYQPNDDYYYIRHTPYGVDFSDFGRGVKIIDTPVDIKLFKDSNMSGTYIQMKTGQGLNSYSGSTQRKNIVDNVILYFNTTDSAYKVNPNTDGALNVFNIAPYYVQYMKASELIYNAYQQGGGGQQQGGGLEDAFGVITAIFTSIGGLMAVELIPNVPLGLFFAVPLFFAVVGVILWIWRKH